jgi:hypothetical protein
MHSPQRSMELIAAQRKNQTIQALDLAGPIF